MRARQTLLVVLATLGLLAGVVPAAHADTATSTYIVQLKKTVSASAATSSLGPNAKILSHVHMAIVKMTAAKAASLSNNPNVVSVSKNIKLKATGVENNAPWDLDLLDNRVGTKDQTYNYPNTGTGVTVYVIDSGLTPTHTEFASANILPGVNFVWKSDPNTTCGAGKPEDSTVDPADTLDQAGHGTAVSSLVVGAKDGVAKNATIVPVRILNCDGVGYGSDYINAADWIIAHHVPGTPAIANVSLGGPGTDLNAVTQAMIDAGITVVVAAGNDNVDACTQTPASAPNAITAAAVTASLTEPAWPYGQSTNWGACVDLYAPGDKVVVASTDANFMPNGQAAADGTSFSSPLIAGAAAQVLADHPSWTPAQVAADLSDRATFGLVTGAHTCSATVAPSACVNLSPNKLLNVGPLGTFAGTAPTIAPVKVDGFATAQLHWFPVPLPTTTTYQWYLDGVAIPGAEAATYEVLPADQGKALTVAVTGSYPGYVSITDTSAATVVDPAPPAGMVESLTPTRLLDTRIGQGAQGPLVSGGTVTLPVAGVAGVARNAAAVLVNITCTGATGSGFITGYASGTPKPGVSNANFAAGKTGANLALIPVGADGAIALTAAVNGGTVQLVVDIQGFITGRGALTEPGAVVPVTPKRLLDTRSTVPLAGRGTRDVLVTGTDAGVPADATAVFLNVTVTSPGTPGFLTVFPTGEAVPTTSNLNFAVAQTVPNLVLVKVGANGSVSIFNAASTAVHVVVDIQGYVTAGTPISPGAVVPISPTRVVDTRIGLGAPLGAVGSGQTRTIAFTGKGLGTESGVFMNLTVTETTASGFISAYPASAATPTISNLNFDPGTTVPNLAAVGLTSSQATVCVAAGPYGSVQLVADVFAYIL